MGRYTVESVNKQEQQRNYHTLSLKKSIMQTRRRAYRAGLLYLLGTILMAAFTIMPMLGMPLVKSLNFTIADLKAAFSGFRIKDNEFWIAALHCLLVCAAVINVLRALGKIKWLFKKKGSRVYGFNRPAYAMEIMGERCAGTFKAIVLTYSLMIILRNIDVSALVLDDVFFMVLAVGVATFIQIVSGLHGSKTAFFIPRPGAEIAEQKSAANRMVSLLCNVVQVVGGFLILFLFLQETTLYADLKMVAKDGFGALTSDMMVLAAFALQVITFLMIALLVGHAVGLTEYNAGGLHAPNVKRARVLAMLVLLCSAGCFAVQYVNKAEAETLQYSYLIIAGIALVVFVLDVVLKHVWQTKEEKKIIAEEQEQQNSTSVTNNTNNTITVEGVNQPIQLPPIYIELPTHPVPYPVPVPMAAPIVTGTVCGTPCGMPCSMAPNAGMNPYAGMPPYVEEMEDAEEEGGKIPYVAEPGEERDWVVPCPSCGKSLKINDGALYHRCPACNQVFQIELKERETDEPPKEEIFSLMDFDADPFEQVVGE